MSYTTTVKETLCRKSCDSCCRKAELYGFLLFSHTFGDEGFYFRTDNAFILKRYEDIFSSLGFSAYSKHEKQAKTTTFYVSAYSSGVGELNKKIGEMNISAPLRIDYSAFENECCASAFLRGVFIAGGFVFTPEKAYHLEIRTAHQLLADDLIRFCEEYDIHLKSASRKGVRVLYIKTSEQIKDFLTFIGASKYVFDFVNTEFEKSLKNNVNRAVNCEQANIDKSVNAAQEQIKAIKKLKKKDYVGIPEDLIALAELRLQNPEMTLVELGEAMEPPLSKSGIAHRMKRITDLSKKRKK